MSDTNQPPQFGDLSAIISFELEKLRGINRERRVEMRWIGVTMTPEAIELTDEARKTIGHIRALKAERRRISAFPLPRPLQQPFLPFQ